MQIIATTPAPTAKQLVGDQLNATQAVIAKITSAPEQATVAGISEGIEIARAAAKLLATATPESKFQDLKEAASQVRTAADLLWSAGIVRHSAGASYATNDRAVADVQRLARDAYDAIEGAWEIVDNN